MKEHNWSSSLSHLRSSSPKEILPVCLPKDAVAFVYQINRDGKYYIGKKNFYSTRKKPFGKKELAKVTDKRKKTYHIVKKESNWQEYLGSSVPVDKLIDSGCSYEKVILRICNSLKESTWYEEKLLFQNLGMSNCLNESIRRVYYKEEVEGWL